MPRHSLALLALLTTSAAPAFAQDDRALVITPAAERAARPAPAEHFTGTARVRALFEASDTARTYGALVEFEPGARTAWHTHPRGQVLLVTSGVGRVQHWGGPVEEIRLGDVVRIPPGTKHWHGAAPAVAMTHIAIVESLNGSSVDWMEEVSDAQYDPSESGSQPSRAQAVMGDIAPKLAQHTDSVLFGDVWSRPELSRRDRSLVTVSALIAMNRPDQLRPHFALARQNGVTAEELIEAITHLAFYAGWPSAVTAVGVAREVLAPARR
ncbi:MAG: carboxymuconolactone decarboxylase family protein [Gemmatimonadaceae bacterium]|jgi:4-carboxymuconolactone decarboxylase|nr:carboxymuconolactone decarboxylase family protein [Gemmatimonadaceae bacterium]